MSNCTNKGRLFIGNDIPIEIHDYRNTFEDDKQITDATITVTATDSDGDEVPGVSWPLTLPYDEDSASYRGTIQSDANWIEGEEYTFIFRGQSPGGLDAQWETTMTAERRTA